MISLLLTNLLPLIGLIGLGYIAGRWLDVNLHSMAIIAIYIMAPMVNFGAVARLDFNPAYMLLPVVIALIGAAMAVTAYKAGGMIFKDETRNLVAMASATGNTGYFGIPIIMSLLGPQALGIYLLMNFALMISEMVGYYLGSHGQGSWRKSLKKLFSLPVVYAIAAGLVWNALNIPLPDIFMTWWERFTGAWVIIGMMLIGVALSKIERFRLNLRLLAFLFTTKHLLWPAAMYGFALIDQHWLHLFNEDIYKMMLVIGIVPLAGNTVAYASQLDLRPGEAAMAVLLSTLFSVIYIPAIFWALGI
ncbi:MAG: AEC family transporter [Micavibrio sp.]